MKEETSAGVFVGFVIGIVIACICANWAWNTSMQIVKEDAVKHGVARWVVIDNAGTTKFEWIPLTIPSK